MGWICIIEDKKVFDFEHVASGLWLNSRSLVAMIFVSVISNFFKIVSDKNKIDSIAIKL